MKQILFTIIFISFGLLTKAQETFTPEQLHQDLDYLKSAIEKFDPAVYHYNLEAGYNELFNAIKQGIESPLTHLEFFKAVSLLCSGAREGHFVVGNANNRASGIFSGFYDDRFKLFPGQILFVKNKAYLLKDFSEANNLPEMSEILSINGEAIDSIKQKLINYIPGDGNIITAKIQRLNKEFGILYYWFIDQPHFYHLKLRSSPLAKAIAIKVPASTTREIRFHAKKRYGDGIKPAADKSDIFEIDYCDNYVYLKLKSFNQHLINAYGLNARRFYKELFIKIWKKKVDNLIIDLRNNGGGSRSFAIEIVPYLLQKEKEGILYESVAYNGKTKKVSIPKPSPYRFNGNIFILVNGNTFSNGSVIAAYAKEFGNAVVIGEESGSRYEGFVAGAKEYITLPNSLIEVQIPIDWLRFQHTEKQRTKNRGVLPDFQVRYSIEEAIESVDKELEIALKLLNEKTPTSSNPK